MTPKTTRSTFYEDFFARAQQFAQDSMALIPELEGVAIVPSWETRQPQLPPALIKGRDGPLHTPQEVLHMAQQLHGALEHVMKASFTVLKTVDDRLAEMARDIQAREEQLRELDARLAAKSST